jgi:acyl-CoA dehydrogenase
MGFDLSREQKDIQNAVREFVKKEFKKDIIEELIENHEYPKKLLKKAAELGFIGINYPEEYSGCGFGCLENIIVAEELARGDSTVGSCLLLSDFASGIILHFGSEDQKRKWLPKTAGGECLSCGAFTESDHGSDITSVNTTAVKDGEEWVINGTKIFITNGGPLAGFYCVLCKTDPDANPSYRGLTMILVEANNPGISTRDVGKKMGISLAYTAEIVLKEVRVPLDNTIGNENKGFYQLMEFFNESRILIAAQALGIAQGAFDRALSYIKKREQFGKKIAHFQTSRHKIADMATKIETARLLTYKAAWKFDRGQADPKLTSMAKMYAARIAVEVCDEAIQLHGGYGYMLEYVVERFYRDAKITELYEGTREIQKNTIASYLIGKMK